METALRISGIGFPPFSAYNCTQTLMPLQIGKFYRTLAGRLHFIGPQKAIKYRSVIEGKDKISPAFERLSIGEVVRVSCIQKIWQLFPEEEGQEGNSITLSLLRSAVSQTLGACTQEGNPLAILEHRESKAVCEKPAKGQAGFLFYAPELCMCLMEFQTSCQEWGLTTQWRLVLEEM